MTYLQFAFSSFWHFAGCFISLCVVTFMAGNLTWRLFYLLTVALRGWPKDAPKGPGLSDVIEL